ncbi:MAG: hypothetical protein WD398_06075 [Cyclobacteriaceae bacterium]
MLICIPSGFIDRIGLDGRGKVLEAVFRVGEGPNEYNSSLLAASFNQEEGGYLAQSSVEFHFNTDLFGILYFEGLSEAATDVRKSADPDYLPIKDPSLYRMIVIHDGVKQVQEIGFPPSCDPRSEILPLPDNRVLFRDRYKGEEEPEYHTYSIFELKTR